MITYSIISILSLSLCYFIYLAFVKTKNHQFSRFFLLLILVGGLSAPLLPISNLFESNLPPINFDFNAEEIFSEHSGEWKSAASNDLGSEKTLIPSEENKPNSLNILSIIFGLITTIFILRFTWNLSLIYRKVKVSDFEKQGKYSVLISRVNDESFSFFNYIFIEDEKNEITLEYILTHEKAHADQLHSVDLIIVKILLCFFWFNPALWFLKKEIIQNHEFLADKAVLKQGFERSDYASTIFNFCRSKRTSLASSFSFINTKKRITMIYKHHPSKTKLLLNLFSALILFAAVLVFSSFAAEKSNPKFVVLLDAGHGGIDPGNLRHGILEKDINLKLALALEKLSDRKVEIRLLRDKDEFIDLNQRLEIAKTSDADLLLSLHLSAGDKHGVQGFYNPESSSAAESKEIAADLVAIFQNKASKINEAKFIILQGTKPSVLLEVGDLANNENLNSKVGQEEIARNLFKSLKTIAENR
ncbi:M56/M15 family metallopeptidase [Zunongwangia profunda]|uniref:M56/M15 family metallopeptidase n=1 Tax=Zunongwangia profunda TaxID=398743 RepID=UPI0005A0BDB2|nr:M56/M15 family metallopeptidase [Zunongwangia profunda]